MDFFSSLSDPILDSKLFKLTLGNNTLSKRILVTGSAGFIGFHLCQRLLKDGYTVVGLDIVNDYYDVKLKEDRLAS